MALEDTRAFLEDLILRYDPDIDLSDGSRAQIDLIDPILQRIGSDPFDEDIQVFVRDRVRQVFPDLAITEEDALQDIIIDPMRVLLEPLVREVKLVKLRSSLANIESLSDDEVDALLSNFFETRLAGGFAVGSVRLFFSTAQSISVTLTNPATTRNGLRFFPSRPQQITADQMLLNVQGSEFYFDVNYRAENRGDEYNVEPGAITSIANIPTATRVRNLRRFRKGVARETSIEFAQRTEISQSDKTLTVERGIQRTLSEAFPALRRLFVIGFRDPEMQRDVIKGGGLGSIPGDDTLGSFFGTGTPIDDLNGDFSTGIVEALTGNFISRLGSAGTDPGRWYMTLVYTDGATLVVTDVRITEVISDTRVRVDFEIPLSVTALTWALRFRALTISDIPGGITFPDTADGLLLIEDDEVHIGGKTDVYVAGETEEATAAITSLTDESPVARGANAETSATNVITINDSPVDADELETGWSIVLEEGVDAGSYRILAASGSAPTLSLTVDQTMTGTQANLAWKIVDDITTELTDPKDFKLTGDDAITAAGSPTVTTASAQNFIDANVQAGDVLRLEGDDLIEGDYTITEVNAVTLEVTPPPPRTAGAVSYSIFRRSEAVNPPLVRISGLELLDSGGAPVGTIIPYRDPVLASSRAFQNEGVGFTFNDLAIVGLVTIPITSVALAGLTLVWEVRDKDAMWDVPIFSGSLIFVGGPFSASDIVTIINADGALNAAGVKATKVTHDADDYVGFICENILQFTAASTAIGPLGLATFETNASVRTFSGASFSFRLGEVYEVLEGNSAGRTGRVLSSTLIFGLGGIFNGGNGPFGVNGNAYNYEPLLPDVGVRVRVGRPSIGSARVYFIDPTSASFRYDEARFRLEAETRELIYYPDPENLRTIRPAPPLTDLPNTGVSDSGGNSLTDADADFQFLDIKPGDQVDLLYIPIDGTSILSPTLPIAVSGLTLILRFDADPFITIAFPFDQLRQEVADYINEQVGVDIASILPSGVLRLQSKSRRLEISSDSTALTVLFLSGAPRLNDHPDQGTYIVKAIPSPTVLTLAPSTPLPIGPLVPDTQYRIRRYLQRASATEMNENQDATGLYYVDVELLASAPGDEFNIDADVTLELTGHRADGYRLLVENENLSYSRGEILTAEISRTILLVGSSDSPEEYVQLSQQNVQVSYDRSQVVDEIQSFADSVFERVVCEEILVRHLLPHYTSLNWRYVGGSAEPDMTRAINEALDAVEPDTELEVLDITNVLRGRGATSVSTIDEDALTGRRAPILVVLIHEVDRAIRAVVVSDFVEVTRLQRYLPGTVTVRRVSPGGIR